LYEEFNANCCIKINSSKFFIEIYEILKQNYKELLRAKVKYIDKSKFGELSDFAGAMKDMSFKHQKEVRALWEPKKVHTIKANRPIVDMVCEGDLFNSTNEDWYKKYVKKECKWLKPQTIFVHEAIKHCSIIYK
jgi:hypothetical protein